MRQKYEETAIKKLFSELDSINILEENKDVIKKHYKENKLKNLNPVSSRHYFYNEWLLAKTINKPFKEMTKDDIVEFLSSIRQHKNGKKGKEYSKSTLNLMKVNLKSFFRWLYGLKKGDYPACVDWLETTLKYNERLSPKEILSPEEVLRLSKHALHTRDRALILTLFDTGCRIEEWLNIKYSDICLEENVATVTVSGKTGSREVYLINSLKAFTDWLNAHPLKDKKDYPI